MKSRKEIKRERNQGEKMRGQRDTGKTLNGKEMGSWDKEVKKSKRRCDSSKEIKDHLHFAFSSAFAVIICSKGRHQPPLKMTPIWMSDLDKLGCWMLFWLRSGLQTVGSPRQDKDITVIGCYTLLPLISDHREWRLQEMGQRAWTDCHNSKANFNNVWDVMCMHQNNMGNSSVILSRSQKT